MNFAADNADNERYIKDMTNELINYVTIHESCSEFMEKVKKGILTRDYITEFVFDNVLHHFIADIDVIIVNKNNITPIINGVIIVNNVVNSLWLLTM
jgi:hypothetical protein